MSCLQAALQRQFMSAPHVAVRPGGRTLCHTRCSSAQQQPERQTQQLAAPMWSRRGALAAAVGGALAAALAPQQPAWAEEASLSTGRATSSAPAPATTIRLDLAPNQAAYNPADPQLREAAALLQKALNAESVESEEAMWTELIAKTGGLEANWVPDVLGRAYGNRGNARSRQGKLMEALADYNKAIEICPWSVDPLLNRGVVLESWGRYEEAIRDYRTILAATPNDPSAWNNLGNSCAGLGRYAEAVEYYGKAAHLAPGFSFASANRAVAMYQLGQDAPAMREMRGLLRKFPDFDDMRAALAASLWEMGSEAEAEEQWGRVRDPRYRDRAWLRADRRWPPRLVKNLEAFLDLRSMSAAAS